MGLAKLTNADGGNSDTRSAGEAEQHREDENAGLGMPGRQPHAQAGDDGEQDGQDTDVVRSNNIRVVSRKKSADNRSRIHDREQVVREVLGETLGEGVSGDVRKRNEERELEQEDTKCSEQKGNLPEDSKVWVGGGVLGGWESRADEADADNAAAETDQCNHSGSPCISNLVKERGQQQRVHDTTDTTGCGRNSSGETTSSFEEVTDSSNRWGKE